MKKWTTYLGVCIIFFSVNVLIIYIRDANWVLVESLMITSVFLLLLLTLDGLSAYFKNKNKSN